MSISGTKLRSELVAEKGAMISPEYGVMPRPSEARHDQALGRRDQHWGGKQRKPIRKQALVKERSQGVF